MSHFITYLALKEPTAVPADRVAERYGELYGSQAYSIVVAKEASSNAVGAPFVVMMDQMPVTVMFIDKPLPHDAYEEALALERVWPEAGAVMAEHRAHAIVALLGDPQEHLACLNGAAAVTLVAGALADLLPTLGVISTEGRVLMRPDMFAPLAEGLARHEVPVPFWTAMAFFRGAQTADGRDTAGAMSFGLRPFIGRELEFAPAPLPPYEVARRLVGLFQYLITNGPVLKDGDSVGVTADEKIRAHYKAQGRRPGVPIIELRPEHIDGRAAPPLSTSTVGGQARKTFGQRRN